MKKIIAVICSLFLSGILWAVPQRHISHSPVHPRPIRVPEPPRRPEPPRDHHHPDGRRLNRGHYRRIDRHRDVRERHGREQIFFEGFWFECSVVEYWPNWVFTDDVYIEMVGPDTYILYDYDDPALQVFVVVVE